MNIDVTAPGATLALGMIYFRSNNRAIAEWMVAPNTPYLLDQVRNSLLFLYVSVMIFLYVVHKFLNLKYLKRYLWRPMTGAHFIS